MSHRTIRNTFTATGAIDGGIREPIALRDFEPQLRFDGSLRDIHLVDAGLAAWSRAAEAIERHGYALSFEGLWSGSRFPSNVADLFKRSPDREMTTLSIDLGGVRLGCHFFTEESIEFDLDPREIAGEPEFLSVVRFMSRLATATERPALLTPENLPEGPILTVLPPSSVGASEPVG